MPAEASADHVSRDGAERHGGAHSRASRARLARGASPVVETCHLGARGTRPRRWESAAAPRAIRRWPHHVSSPGGNCCCCCCMHEFDVVVVVVVDRSRQRRWSPDASNCAGVYTSCRTRHHSNARATAILRNARLLFTGGAQLRAEIVGPLSMETPGCIDPLAAALQLLLWWLLCGRR